MQASIPQLGDDARDEDYNRDQYYAELDAEHDAFLEGLRDAELDAKLRGSRSASPSISWGVSSEGQCEPQCEPQASDFPTEPAVGYDGWDVEASRVGVRANVFLIPQ